MISVLLDQNNLNLMGNKLVLLISTDDDPWPHCLHHCNVQKS